MNIFISENDEKDEVFDRLVDILDIKKLRVALKDVFKKVYNNWVGYYTFKDEDTYFKIFVLPKNIIMPKKDDKEDETRAIKEFIFYLQKYYELQVKYPAYNSSNLELKSIVNFSFDSQSNSNGQELEPFVFYKYQVFLKHITNFFKTHKSLQRVKTNYTSQTIKHRFDLMKNIKEIDKTKIHQQKYEDIIYSQMATLAYGAIKLFLRQKIESFENDKNKKELLALSYELQNLLKKRFKADKSFNLSLHKLTSTKIAKVFKKKQTHKALYQNILALFGLENFFDEQSNKEINHNIESNAMFLRPEILYEWYVYDYIHSDKIHELYSEKVYLRSDENKKSYFIYKDDLRISSRKSEPDIIVDKNDNKIILDVKWKQLKTVEIEEDGEFSYKTKTLNMQDVLKLQRDARVHKATEAYLVFLSLPKGTNGREFKVKYDENEEVIFTFKMLEIPFELKRVSNA